MVILPDWKVWAHHTWKGDNSIQERHLVHELWTFSLITGNGNTTSTTLRQCYQSIYDFQAVHFQLGMVAHSCNPAAGKLGLVDGVRSGYLSFIVLCRSGVRIKLGVNMVVSAEARATRLSKEGRTGPGRRRSRQKSPRQAVVGSRPWIVGGGQPVQENWTQSFSPNFCSL